MIKKQYTPDPWEECAGIKKPKAGYVLFEAKGKDGKKAIQLRKPYEPIEADGVRKGVCRSLILKMGFSLASIDTAGSGSSCLDAQAS